MLSRISAVVLALDAEAAGAGLQAAIPAVIAHHKVYSGSVLAEHLIRSGIGPDRLVLYRLRVIELCGPLAQVHGVRAPLENPASMEIVEVPPAASHIGRVVRTPGSGSQPAIPVEHLSGRQLLGGQPAAAR